MSKKSSNKKLYETLTSKKESAWNYLDKKKVFDFCENYKHFLKDSKTERLCVENVIKVLKNNNFKNFNTVKSLKTNDKVFKVFKNKTVVAFIVGQEKESLNIIGSHVDSPRLDLKPKPLYEDSNLALLKTHYYGGIKKYQWVNEPLELQGVVFTKENKKVNINIRDYAFVVPDLLPHLAKEQMKKEANKVVEGESLNVLVGNIPVNDKEIKDQVKFTVLKHLNMKYGITEDDFFSAELELVPRKDPLDIGFDKSMIGAYGQDDRVAVFTSLKALVNVKKSKKTIVGLFVDKEETGSEGDTGAQSLILQNFAEDYRNLLKIKMPATKILENSKSISADVTGGLNPNYKEVQDVSNASYLGFGVSIEKYGGSGGKGHTNDAHAEYISEIRQILIKNKIPYQFGENGKVDMGGGGTIAMYMSKYGMDCVDVGPAVLAMHSPFEVTSKVDVYCCYLFYKAFFEN